MLTQQTINFIVIRNPMTPDNRLHLERVWIKGDSLHDYIGDLQGSYAISKNGVAVSQNELSLVIPNSKDVVVICPIMHGGGEDTSKTIMRLVAVVALTVLTSGLGSITGLADGALMAAQAAVAVGGTLLINAVLPIGSLDSGLSSGDGASTDYTYGIDGAKNSSKDNIPVPIVYGRHRQGGNIIGNYTEQQGDVQFLNVLINAGEGVIAGIDLDSIIINDQPMSSLSYAPEVKVYYGNDDQDVPSGFMRQIIPVSVAISPELSDNTIWTEHLTAVGREVESVQANFNCSIVKINSKGNEVDHYVDVEAQIAAYGTEDWVAFSTGIKIEDGDNGYIFDYVTSPTGGLGRYDATGKTVTKLKIGSQYVDPKYPNKFNETYNQYDNEYSKKDESFTLIGTAVDESGKAATTIYYGSNQPNSSSSKAVTVATKDGKYTIPSYDYGVLMVDGVRVGTYHDFHKVNIIKRDFNNVGLSGGSRSGRTLRLTGSSSSANQRYSYESARLAQGRYKVRVKRELAPADDNRTGDDVAMNEVNEILFSEVAYNYTALLQIRMQVTDQITSIPTITYENLGRVIRVWDEEAKAWHPSCNSSFSDSFFIKTAKENTENNFALPFTSAEKKETLSLSGIPIPNSVAFERPSHMLAPENSAKYVDGFYMHTNPAWIALDILTDDRWGASVPIHRINFFAFKEWADYCEEANLHFRGVISDSSNVWDTIAKVFKVGRATPLRMGTRYSVSVEKPKMPVMRFAQDNIVKDTFSTSWMSIDDRANEIELTFFDEEIDYASRTIKVYDKQALERGNTPITASLTVQGISTEEQAIREAVFTLNYNKLIQTVSFEAPIESLACVIGDVIKVQHDMMEWGLAGKIANVKGLGDGSYEITLDQDFTFENDRDWQLTLNLNVESKGSFIVSNVYGNYITLSGFDIASVGEIKRAVINGKDLPVFDTFKSSNDTSGIVIQDATGITVGTAIELFNTDVLTAVPLTPSVFNAPTDKVTVTGLKSSPEQYNGFLIGYETFESRLFTVRSIGLTGSSMTRKISGLEYDERALSDTDSDFTITDVVRDTLLGPVTGIEITDEPYLDSLTDKAKISIAWEHDDYRYKDALVTARVRGLGDQFLGAKTLNTELIIETGRSIDFIIVPRDSLGREGLATTVSHVSEGGTINPYVPVGLNIESMSGGAKLVWQSTSNYLSGTEVYAIKTGTKVGIREIDLDSPSSYSETTVLQYAEKLGITKQESFTHLTETESTRAVKYYYWVRTVDLSENASELIYVGFSTPFTSASYNSVTVYQWSVLSPVAPTGGTYENNTPDQAEWSKIAGEQPEVTSGRPKLWQSSRRFSNIDGLGDLEWSAPSSISSANELTYTWVAYADDASGKNITTVIQPSSNYIGHAYNKSSPIQSTVHSDYIWEFLILSEVSVASLISDAVSGDLYDSLSESITDSISEYVKESVSSDITANSQAILDLDAKTNSISDSVTDLSVQVDEKIAGVNTNVTELVNQANDSIVDLSKQVNDDLLLTDANLKKQISDLALSVTTADDVNSQAIGGLSVSLSAKEKSILEKIALSDQGISENKQSIVNEGLARATLSETLLGKIGDNTAAIINVNEVLATEVTARSELGTSLLAKINDQTSLIESNSKAIADESIARASLSTTLLGKIGDNTSAISANSDAITSETEARSELETTLISRFKTNESSIASNASAITDEASARSQLATLLTARFESNESTISSNSKAISDESIARAALSTSLNTKLDNNSADIITANKAITSANEAITALSTSLNTKIDNNSTAIDTNSTAITTANDSIASLNTTLLGKIGENTGKIDIVSDAIVTTNNSITSLNTTLLGKIGTNATAIETNRKGLVTANTAITTLSETLLAKINSNTASNEINADAIVDEASARTSLSNTMISRFEANETKINTNTQAITSANLSIASLETLLLAKLNANTALIATNSSVITSETSARALLETTLVARFKTNESSITNQGTAITDANNAISSLSDTVTANFNANKASIQIASDAIATANGVYQAQWGVKTNVNGLTGGIGFYNNGSKTQFVVTASSFAILDGTTLTSPFSVVGGVTSINDAYINKAYIETLTASYIDTKELTAVNITGGQITIGEKFSVNTEGNLVGVDVDLEGRLVFTNGDEVKDSMSLYGSQSPILISGGGYETNENNGFGIHSSGFAKFSGGLSVNDATIEGATIIGADIYSGNIYFAIDYNTDGSSDDVRYVSYPLVPVSARSSYTSSVSSTITSSTGKGVWTFAPDYFNVTTCTNKWGSVNSNRFRWGKLRKGALKMRGTGDVKESKGYATVYFKDSNGVITSSGEKSLSSSSAALKTLTFDFKGVTFTFNVNIATYTYTSYATSFYGTTKTGLKISSMEIYNELSDHQSLTDRSLNGSFKFEMRIPTGATGTMTMVTEATVDNESFPA